MKPVLLRLTVVGILLVTMGIAFSRNAVTAQPAAAPVYLPFVHKAWPTPTTGAPRPLYRLAPTVGRSEGGNSYEDHVPDNGRVYELWIRAGIFVDALQTWYLKSDGDLYTPGRRGGTGGTLYRILFDSDEYIVGLNGRSGMLMESLSVVTNKRTYGPYGGPGGDTPFSILAPSGSEIVGFFGRSGQALDNTGAFARQLSPIPVIPPIGGPRQVLRLLPTVGWGRTVTYEDPVPEDGRVYELWVRAGLMVDSLQIWYLKFDGTLYTTGRRGLSPGGDLHKVTLDPDEYIVALNGKGGEFMDSLSVVTNKRTFGPWGGPGGDPFSIDTPTGYEICGFYGELGLGLPLTGALARQRR